MKWNKFATTLTATAVAASLMMPQSAFAAETRTPPSLVALGDSISYGWNLGNNLEPSKYAFPFVLGQMIHFNTTDLSVPGWTSQNLLTALETSEQYQSAVRAARVITLDIGSNDLLSLASSDGILASPNPTLTPAEQQQFTTALTQMGTNLTQILGAVKQLNPSATIALYNLYDPFGSALPPHAIGEMMISAANGIIANVAKQFNTPVVDAYSAFNGMQSLFVRPNDVHPTIFGQKTLAVVGLFDLLLQKFQHKFEPRDEAVLGDALGEAHLVRLP